jgi:small multidrug resistance family-3 protein
MFKFAQSIPIPLTLLIAAALEAGGDAVVRQGLYNGVGLSRLALIGAGGLILLGYGTFLNTAPVDFGRVVGLYIAMLFVVWQIINFLIVRALPSIPVCVGGLLVVAGGMIVTLWPAK